MRAERERAVRRVAGLEGELAAIGTGDNQDGRRRGATSTIRKDIHAISRLYQARTKQRAEHQADTV